MADQLVLLRLDTSASLLQFDLKADKKPGSTKKTIGELLDHAESATNAQFLFEVMRFPAAYRKACIRVHAAIMVALTRSIGTNANIELRVRVASRVLSNSYAYRVTHTSFAMGEYTDDRLVLPIGGSKAGAVARSSSGDSVFLVDPIGSPESLPGLGNRYSRALRWQHASWMLFVPIHQEDEVGSTELPELIMIVDGNTDPELTRQFFYDSTHGREAISGYADIIRNAMKQAHNSDGKIETTFDK